LVNCAFFGAGAWQNVPLGILLASLVRQDTPTGISSVWCNPPVHAGLLGTLNIAEQPEHT